MTFHKWFYKTLVAIRRWLNRRIDAARARAFPQTGGRRRRVAPEQPSLLP